MVRLNREGMAEEEENEDCPEDVTRAQPADGQGKACECHSPGHSPSEGAPWLLKTSVLEFRRKGHKVFAALLVVGGVAVASFSRARKKKKRMAKLEDVQPVFQTETWRKLN